MLMRFEIHDAGRRPIDLAAGQVWPFSASEWTGFARRDTDDAVIYTLDVPRYRRKDLSVEVDGERVIVRGDQSEGFLKPKSRRSFVRSFTLPDTLDPSDVRADFREGVLLLTVAKRPAARARRIAVQVDGKRVTPAATTSTDEPRLRPSFWQRLVGKLRAA
jgi:HSP20 family molecular chaperone IbpA